MIFKLDGTARNLLALTPVLREWKRRFPKAKALVETFDGGVLDGCPYVDEVSGFFARDYEDVLDLNQISWQAAGRHVTEVYAEAVFGDLFLESWSVIMTHTREDELDAIAFLPTKPGKRLAVGPEMTQESIAEAVRGGWTAFPVSRALCGSWGVFQAVVAASDAYVGIQGDETVAATTTGIPVVALHAWEDPEYFLPFRKGIPIEYVMPSKDVCSQAEVCLRVNGLCEFNRTYGIKCSNANRFACRSWDCARELALALGRVTAKVEAKQ